MNSKLVLGNLDLTIRSELKSSHLVVFLYENESWKMGLLQNIAQAQNRKEHPSFQRMIVCISNDCLHPINRHFFKDMTRDFTEWMLAMGEAIISIPS